MKKFASFFKSTFDFSSKSNLFLETFTEKGLSIDFLVINPQSTFKQIKNCDISRSTRLLKYSAQFLTHNGPLGSWEQTFLTKPINSMSQKFKDRRSLGNQSLKLIKTIKRNLFKCQVENKKLNIRLWHEMELWRRTKIVCNIVVLAVIVVVVFKKKRT